MLVNHELKSIYDNESRILILGSLPSIKSRSEGFYYAHPQNRFWKILSTIYHVSFKSNDDKIKFLHEYHIALWDTISSCEITGSSDSSIKNIKVNDINELLGQTKITKIYCTGKLSYKIYNKYIYPQTNILASYLSSPSPANAQKSLTDLIKEYLILVK